MQEDQWTHADGRPKSYAERKAERTTADRQKQRESQQQREQQRIERQLNPQPAPPSYPERVAQRKAEEQGRKLAEEKNAPPVDPNPFRKIAKEYEHRQYLPEYKRRYERMTAEADRWDAQREQERQAAERKAAIDADPQVRTARDYAAGLVKLTRDLPDEFGVMAAECVGIADVGDAKLAWQKMNELDQRIWRHHDKIAAEKLAGKNVTDADFREAANAAEAARERAEKSASEAANE